MNRFSLFFSEYGMYFFSAELLQRLHSDPPPDPAGTWNITAAFLSNMSLSEAESAAASVFFQGAGNVTTLRAVTTAATNLANSSALFLNATNATNTTLLSDPAGKSGADLLSVLQSTLDSLAGAQGSILLIP